MGKGCSVDRVLEYVSKLASHCGVVSVTLRLYDPFQKRLYHALLEDGWRVAGFLYPRLLFLRRYGGPEDYVARGMNKKARNRWRLFRREGGHVEPVDDVVAVAVDLYRALVSEPVRQGRPIPRSWRSPGAVARMARGMTEGVRMGFARAWGAFLDGRLVGFMYVPMTRMHGLVSMFVVNMEYARYGVGNALLAEAVMDMIREGRPLVLQYGYFRPVNEGINRFLERHGFRPGLEAVLVRSGWRGLGVAERLYSVYVRVSERVSSRLVAYLAQVLRKL